MMRRALGAAAAAAAASLAAAGAQGAGYNKPAAPKYSEEDVAAALGLRRPEPGMSWQDEARECVAAVILLDRKTIKLYAEAGDTVATDPSGSVGVKVVAYAGVDKRMCFERFEAALRKLP